MLFIKAKVHFSRAVSFLALVNCPLWFACTQGLCFLWVSNFVTMSVLDYFKHAPCVLSSEPALPFFMGLFGNLPKLLNTYTRTRWIVFGRVTYIAVRILWRKLIHYNIDIRLSLSTNYRVNILMHVRSFRNSKIDRMGIPYLTEVEINDKLRLWNSVNFLNIQCKLVLFL